MPSGTAITIDTIRPSSVNSAEAGSRLLISRRHRLSGGQRGAEIAVGEIDDIAAELHDQRLVEAELDRALPAIACGVAAGPAK